MELINEIDETICFNENNIRVIGTFQEPWFVAKDVCEILELKDVSNALLNIPEKWKGTKVIRTLGGKQDMRIINEAGLYKLIMRSNKPIAQKFQEVVCEEILPTLRKKGEYKIQSIIDRNKELEEEKLRLEEEKNKKEEELTKLTKKYVKPKKEIIEHKNVVYLMTTEESEKKREYVVGKATDLNNRKDNYDHNKLHDFKIVYYISLENSKLMDIIEASILMKLGKYRSKAGRDVFLLPEPDISIFTNIFDECAKFYDNVHEDDVVYAKRTYTNEDTKKYNATRKEVMENYSEEKKEQIKQKQKEYQIKNEEAFSELCKIEHNENREKHNEMCSEYYGKNKEDIKQKASDFYYNNKSFILDESKKRYKENKDEIKEIRKEYYEKNYKDKIATQRQKKEKCECGLVVSHYQMKNHKKTEKHTILMEIKNNKQTEIIDSDKKRCECGMVITLISLKNHIKSNRHKMFMELIEEMKNEKPVDEDENEDEDEDEDEDDEYSENEEKENKSENDEICECGFILSSRCMRRHKRSKRHKLLMDKKLKDNKEVKVPLLPRIVEESVAAPVSA